MDHVAHLHLALDGGDHEVDVEPLVGNLARRDLDAREVGQDGQDRIGDLLVLDALELVRKQRAVVAPQRAHHAPVVGRKPRKPLVDVVGEQFRGLCLHAAVIVSWDLGVRRDLLVGYGEDGEVTVLRHDQLDLAVFDVRAELLAGGDVVLLLAHIGLDLGRQFAQGKSGFHGLVLQVFRPKSGNPDNSVAFLILQIANNNLLGYPSAANTAAILEREQIWHEM